MSSISYKTEADRIEAQLCRCLEPWVVGALLIAGIILPIIGSIALPAHIHHLPWGFFTKIPMDQSILMISIGTLGLGISIWRLVPPRPKLDVDQAITTLRQKIPNLEERTEEKLYYYPQTDTLNPSRELGAKETRLTLKRITPDGPYYAKTGKKLGRGVQKTAYLVRSLQENFPDQVRTVERNPPANDELAIYEALKACPHVVHCLAVVKDTEQKRSLILEMCPKTLKAADGLTQAQILTFFEGYLRGLAALHEAGYLHLDCHEGNLFIDAKERGRLADFGSSRPIDSLNTVEGFGKMMPVQTRDESHHLPLAMAFHLLAPEIVRCIGRLKEGQRDKKEAALVPISGKADVWTLGNILAKKLKPQSSAYQKTIECQEAIQPVTPNNQCYCPFTLSIEKNNQYHQDLLSNYPDEPINQASVDYLIWKMLHPDHNLRFSAQEAAEYISTLRKITQDS